jgi:L-asparaginase
METQTHKFLVVVIAALLAATPAAWALPKITVLATGGTIAGAQATQADAGYKSGTFSVDDLIKAVPQMTNIAVMSANKSPISAPNDECEVFQFAAGRNAQERRHRRRRHHHGTDTMEETGYFLSLVVKSEAGGARRRCPATAISDGPINLYNAVALRQPEPRPRPLVMLTDTIHYARETQKTHTTRMDTFQSPNRGIAGMMNTGKAFFYSANTARHTTKSEFSIDGLTVANLPRVDVVYSYANLGGDMIDALVEKGVKGIVLAGVGDGNSTDAAVAALEKAAKKGIAVVRCSRTGSGVVDRNVEINDDKLGFIAGMELSAQKARILLMLALTKTSDVKKLQEYFYQY